MRMIRRTAALAATVLIMVGVPATASTASTGAPAPVKPQGGTIDPHKVQWTSAKPIRNGRYLRVTWWSGVEPCSVLDRVTVKEGRGKVTVTLYEGSAEGAGMCVMLAVKKSTIVKLRAPIGDRRVADGAKR